MSDNILTLEIPTQLVSATPQKGIARGATFDPVTKHSRARTASKNGYFGHLRTVACRLPSDFSGAWTILTTIRAPVCPNYSPLYTLYTLYNCIDFFLILSSNNPLPICFKH